jgi:hypothetical protein
MQTCATRNGAIEGANMPSNEETHGVALALALEEDGVAAEEVELVHLGLAERHDRVVVGARVLDNQAVGLGLGAQDGCGGVAVNEISLRGV